MKKNILIFGSISGLIVSAVMITTAIACYQNGEFEGNMVIGFGSMILAFSFIFVAIKNYRDHHHNGQISFAKALKIGLLISLVGSTMYVLCWVIVYYNFFPDYMEKFVSHSIADIKSQNLSQAETKEQIAGISKYKEWYRSPVLVVLLTYTEILPIGVLVAVISALFLKTKNNQVSAKI